MLSRFAVVGKLLVITVLLVALLLRDQPLEVWAQPLQNTISPVGFPAPTIEPIRNARPLLLSSPKDEDVLSVRVCMELPRPNGEKHIRCNLVSDLLVFDPSTYRSVWDALSMTGFDNQDMKLIGCGQGNVPVWVVSGKQPLLQRTANQISYTGPSAQQRDIWRRSCEIRGGTADRLSSLGSNFPGGSTFNQRQEDKRFGESMLDQLASSCTDSTSTGMVAILGPVMKILTSPASREFLKWLAGAAGTAGVGVAVNAAYEAAAEPEEVPVDQDTTVDPKSSDDYVVEAGCDPSQNSCEVEVIDPSGGSSRTTKVNIDSQHNATEPKLESVDNAGKTITTHQGNTILILSYDKKGNLQYTQTVNTQTGQTTTCINGNCTTTSSNSTGNTSTQSSTELPLPGELSRCERVAMYIAWIKEYCAASDWQDGMCQSILRRMRGCISTNVINPGPEGDSTCPLTSRDRKSYWELECKRKSMIARPMPDGKPLCQAIEPIETVQLFPDMCSNPKALVTSEQCPGRSIVIPDNSPNRPRPLPGDPTDKLNIPQRPQSQPRPIN